MLIIDLTLLNFVVSVYLENPLKRNEYQLLKMLLLTDRYLVLLRKEDTDIVTPRLSMTKYTHNIVRYFVENTCDT